jgi:glycogen(starch) synthase
MTRKIKALLADFYLRRETNMKTSKKLNIVFLDFDDIKNPLLAAGQAKATLEVGSRLVKKGHQVTIISSRFPGYKDRMENGMHYKHIGLGTQNIKLNNLAYIFALPFMVRKLKADVIIECFTAPISTLFSPIFTKIPVIILPSMFNAREFSKKYHLPLYMIEEFGLKFYKYMMPYSDIDSSKAKRINPKLICNIIPQGVGEEFFQIKHQKPSHILFLSRFDIDQKGIDILLKAYARVNKKINYPLVLGGHGPDEKKIVEMIKTFGLEEKVKIVGPLYGQKKVDFIASSIYVAFPSRHDELSLWALEALASGMPLIAFDLPEAKWMTDDVALKAKPLDIDQYSNLLLKGTDTKINNKMRIAARKLASKYSWENVADKFDIFMFEVLRRETNYEKSN